MRFVSWIFVASILLAATLAYAMDKVKKDAVAAHAPDSSRVQVVTDDERGTIQFVIDGKLVAVIDATGLHVREDISYGDVLTDYGASSFDAHLAEAGHAQ